MYQAFRIHREIFDLNWNPLRKPETVHGITSFTAWQANPADILAGNRGHWGVENREHYVRDRTFDEDRSQVRTGASPQFLATARNIVMSLLRLAGCENVARGMEYLSRRLDQILALLGVLPEPIRKGDAYTTTLPMTLSCPYLRTEHLRLVCDDRVACYSVVAHRSACDGRCGTL